MPSSHRSFERFFHYGVELAKVEIVPVVSQPNMIIATRQPALSERVVKQINSMKACALHDDMDTVPELWLQCIAHALKVKRLSLLTFANNEMPLGRQNAIALAPSWLSPFTLRSTSHHA